MNKPLFSIEAEQAVIGGLLIDPSVWGDALAILKPEHFYRLDHQLIFAAISAVSCGDDDRDPGSVAAKLFRDGKLLEVGGLAYLTTLANDTPSAAHTKVYAAIVRERAQLRRLVRGLGEIVDLVLSSEARAPRDVLEDARRLLSKIEVGIS